MTEFFGSFEPTEIDIPVPLTICGCGHGAFEHFVYGRCIHLDCKCQQYDKEDFYMEAE